MQGLVSIIQGDLNKKITEFWKEMEDIYGKIFVKPVIPHFSWFGGEKFPEMELKKSLEKFFENGLDAKVRSGGIALFPSNELIIYIPIVVSQILLKIHTDLFNKVIVPLADQIQNNNQLYFPNNWVPHITLIQQKKDSINFNEIFTQILELNSSYEFDVSSLALIDDKGNKIFELRY